MQENVPSGASIFQNLLFMSGDILSAKARLLAKLKVKARKLGTVYGGRVKRGLASVESIT